MSFYAKSGTLSLTTADSGTKASPDLGFVPKVVLFWTAAIGMVSSVNTRQSVFGVMYGAGLQACYTCGARDGASQTRTGLYTNLTLNFRENTGSSGGRYAASGFVGNTFELSVTNPVLVNTDVHYLALGGTECEVAVGTKLIPGTTGATAVTGLPFQPNALVAVGTRQTALGDANGATFSLGFATASSEQGQVAWQQQEGSSNATTLPGTNRVTRRANTFGGFDKQVSFTAFTSDGFTLNVDDADTDTFLMLYVALVAPEAKAGTTTLQTSPGTWDVDTIGFEPVALFAVAGPGAAVSGSTANGGHIAAGFTDGVHQGGATLYVHNGAFDATVATYTDALLKGYQRDAADTFSVASTASFSTFLADGVQLEQDSAAAVQGIVAYLAFGAGAGAPGPDYSYYRRMLLRRRGGA